MCVCVCVCVCLEVAGGIGVVERFKVEIEGITFIIIGQGRIAHHHTHVVIVCA